MSTTTEAITRLQNYPADTPACVIIWLPDDIKTQARQNNLSVSDELAADILELLFAHHDCNYGITWDHINAELSNYRDHEGLKPLDGRVKA